MNGILYVVATPIGHPDDMTLRALDVLRAVDAVLCEELAAGERLLAQYGIRKLLFAFNEHTEGEFQTAALERLAAGESLALISDHGTPVIQDPGGELVRAAIQRNIRVVPIPGASSVLAALVVSGLPAARFRFVGLLPRKAAERRKALEQLRPLRETLILIDAPYRLGALLKSVHEVMGGERDAAVACNLTMPGEQVVRGTLAQVVEHFTANPFKGEFVVILEGARSLSSARQ